VTGLRARGDVGVDIAWADDALSEAVLTPDISQTLTVRSPDLARLKVTDSNGDEVRFEAVANYDGVLDGDTIRFEAEAGETYRIAAGAGFSTVHWLIDRAEQEGVLAGDVADDVRERVEKAEDLAGSPASRTAVIAQLDNAARKGAARADLVEAIGALTATFR
jgi:hypothetical protein